jgi:hypothetical protein
VNGPKNKIVAAKRLQQLRSQVGKVSWFRVSVKLFGLGMITAFSVLFRDKHRMIRPVVSFQAREVDKRCKHLSNSLAETLPTLLFSMCYELGMCS